MKLKGVPSRPLALALSAALLSLGLRTHANINNWTNPASALWRSATNWSQAVVPSSTSLSDPTQITNTGTKTVMIDSATAAANLSLRGLNLSAPAGATNTLALVNVPLGTPLTTSKPLLVGNRGALAITNSAVNATADFDIVNASLVLDSGSLTCALNCDLQSGGMIVNAGTLTATAGTTGIRLGRLNGAKTVLTINGGTVSTLRLTLGSVTSTSNTLALAGGTLLSPTLLSVGQLQNSVGYVAFSAGNLFVTNGTALIGDRGNGTFAQSGGKSAFNDVRFGDSATGTCNLSGGEFLVTPRTTNDLAIIGNHGTGTWNQSGGVTVIRSELHVSDFPGDGSVFPPDPPSVGVVNLTGGLFFATNDLVAIGRYGIGEMTVSNATAVLTNTSVGRHDTGVGTLTLQSNANLFLIADLSIGRLTNSTGHVFVNEGLLSLTNDDLWVGRGGAGDFTVSGGLVRAKRLHIAESDDGTNAPTGSFTLSGGAVLVSSNFTVGTPLLSTGHVAVTGGLLTVTNDLGNALLAIRVGDFTMSGGTLLADKMVLTNADSGFTLNKGNLQLRSLTVANGLPFVVGDGVNPATLTLNGGTFSFANGLVISPNATVTGCGTIIGDITNNGIYNNPCDIPKIEIRSITTSSNTANVTFKSLNGLIHTLEFKEALSNPSWTPLPPGTLGGGNTMTLTDPSATNATRFYRIHAE